MVVTRLLSKLVSWMRAQQGSPKLRVLVYMDEVYGFVPPTAAPPSKKPILTLFKQARAYGVGVVLSTQNPVDLDFTLDDESMAILDTLDEGPNAGVDSDTDGH